MNRLSTAFAKLAGIRKSLESVLNDDFKERGQVPIRNFAVDEVIRYFDGAATLFHDLRDELPDLYGDLPDVDAFPEVEMAKQSTGYRTPNRYARRQLEQLARQIDEIFEIRANSQLEIPSAATNTARRVFLSHGHANDWLEVQAYVERVIELPTLELAQEANRGRTVLAKLDEESMQCDSAVIVMTGDDQDAAGQPKARENVIHEVGFFQGRYGLSRVCLLYEEGVAIPSNIHGLVYVPFPKGMISAAFGVLVRELHSMYK